MKKQLNLIVLFLFVSLSHSQSITDGLIGYWPLMDGTANDESINSNHGAISGAIQVADRFNVSNGALMFDGTDDYIDCGSNTPLNDIWNQFSISVWIKVYSSPTNQQSIMSKGNSSGKNNFNLSIETDGRIRFWFSNTAALTFSTSSVGDGEWHHVVAVWNGTQNILYIDNVQEQTSGNIPNVIQSGSPLLIGSWDFSWNFNGQIDETRIYNRTLSSSEVDLLYNYQDVVTPPQTSGNFWEDNGTNIYHLGKVSVNGNELPSGYELAVNGKTVTKELKVTLSDWPDYVFEKNYKLLKLKEVEQYILEKKHLPEIPSRKEVLDNGIFVGNMNAKLLQKIEELTLYTIEQEKKIVKQSKEIEELKFLSKRVNEIEKKLLNK